jgi:hypothetical protein
MIEAVRTSETSVNFNVTKQRYIPEVSELHSRRSENLKSHTKMTVFWNVLPYTAVEIYRRFIGTYCLHHKSTRKAVSSCETSVNLYETTRRNKPKYSCIDKNY